MNAGGPLSVSVAGSADVATIVLVLGDRSGQIHLARRSGPATTFSLTVPTELAGTRTLVAIGQDAAGRPLATSSPVTLDVAVPAALQALTVYPESVYLKVGLSRRLEITGSYDDGVERNLSHVEGLVFSFAEGRASRDGSSGVTLDDPAGDALTISYQGVAAPEVRIRALTLAEPPVTARPLRRRLAAR